MPDIRKMPPQSGRMVAEDNTLVNIVNAVTKAIRVELTGSTVDLRGKASDKPSASSVAVGTTYWSVDTDPHADAIEVSDGTSWGVIAWT